MGYVAVAAAASLATEWRTRRRSDLSSTAGLTSRQDGPARVPGYLPGEDEFDGMLINLAELVLKGKNRREFEKKIFNNIVRKVDEPDSNCPDDLAMNIYQGYFLMMRDETRGRLGRTPMWHKTAQIPKDVLSEDDINNMRALLKEIPGIDNCCVCKMANQHDWEEVKAKCIALCLFEWRQLYAARPSVTHYTFRVNAKRNDKTFPISSPEMLVDIGSSVVTWFDDYKPPLQVDLRRDIPQDIVLNLKIRQDCALMWTNKTSLSGGLPVGTAGRVLSLLSGGFDSPVASERVINRGCTVDFVHFDGYPYTSKEVVDKVRRIQRVLNGRQPPELTTGTLYTIPFSKIQEAIRDTAPESYRTVLYRIYMMKLSSMLAHKIKALALVTGDSLGQVASQTLNNLAAIDALGSPEMLVLRPLLTWNKCDIIHHCREIGTYLHSEAGGTEDCCTVFAPKAPVVSAEKSRARHAMECLENETGMSSLLQDAIKSMSKYTRKDTR